MFIWNVSTYIDSKQKWNYTAFWNARCESIASMIGSWLYVCLSDVTPAMDMAKCSATYARARGSWSFTLSCRLSGKWARRTWLWEWSMYMYNWTTYRVLPWYLVLAECSIRMTACVLCKFVLVYSQQNLRLTVEVGKKVTQTCRTQPWGIHFIHQSTTATHGHLPSCLSPHSCMQSVLVLILRW